MKMGLREVNHLTVTMSLIRCCLHLASADLHLTMKLFGLFFGSLVSNPNEPDVVHCCWASGWRRHACGVVSGGLTEPGHFYQTNLLWGTSGDGCEL